MKDEQTPIKKSIWVLLATCYPMGDAPFAPGTFGSIVGLVVAIGVKILLPHSDFGTYSAIIVAIALCAWGVIYRAAPYFPIHDDPRIVIDEVVGQFIAIIYMPLTLKTTLVGFCLFRLFDILKPLPISLADKHIPGAFGVLFDDILAGIMAAIVLLFASYYNLLGFLS